jgi:hypothetical protein
LPTSGQGDWRNLIMPAVALGWYFAASLLRLTRSSMIEVLRSEYVKLARGKPAGLCHAGRARLQEGQKQQRWEERIESHFLG